MPEYLAPGVFVEETAYRAKTINGVGTTTAGLVGASRYGPVDLDPAVITSIAEFEQTFGGRLPLQWGGNPVDNHLWNAVRGFFEEGGTRLYVARAFTPTGADASDFVRDCARAVDPPPPANIIMRARFPGRAGEAQLRLTFVRGQNRFAMDAGVARVRGGCNRDVVRVTGFVVAGKDRSGLYLLTQAPQTDRWTFTGSTDAKPAVNISFDLQDLAAASATVAVRAITVTVTAAEDARERPPYVAAELALDPLHQQDGRPDSLFAHFAPEPATPAQARSVPIVIAALTAANGGAVDGLAFLNGFIAAAPAANRFTRAQLDADPANPALTTATFMLQNGSDGQAPTVDAFAGTQLANNRFTGLRQFESIEDIAIVAAPGSTCRTMPDGRPQAIANALISHARSMRYRIAVLDSVEGHSISEVRAYRGQFDSSHAALYYPWVRIIDPATGQPNTYPPSGFVAGIYARNDMEQAVYKAPANQVVRLAIGFEQPINAAQQAVLNSEGINCFRVFEGRGMRLWGARTVSSDPQWKYVNLRRYFAFLERSIDKGTQWAVFEPNGEALWANMRRSIEDFLMREWQSGALLGDRPEKAYFIKCDRSTMTQNDLDNGRLVCLIGVAPLRPAEFIILRIGQWTADRQA